MSVSPIQFVPGSVDVELASLGLPPEDDHYPEPVEEQTQGGLQIVFEDVEFKEEVPLPNAMDSEEYRQSELIVNHTFKAYGGKRAVVVFLSGMAALGSGTGLLTGGVITAVKTHKVGIWLLGAGGGLLAALGAGSVIDLLRLKQVPQVISNKKLFLAGIEVLLAGGCLLPFFLPLPE